MNGGNLTVRLEARLHSRASTSCFTRICGRVKLWTMTSAMLVRPLVIGREEIFEEQLLWIL